MKRKAEWLAVWPATPPTEICWSLECGPWVSIPCWRTAGCRRSSSPSTPRRSAFDFTTFYDLIKSQGFIIYPGKLTEVESFRIGCIGQLFTEQMQGVLAAVRTALDALGIPDGTPRPKI
jgi:hypothetical protein